MLGVSRTIHVNVDSPYLGFLIGGTTEKPPCTWGINANDYGNIGDYKVQVMNYLQARIHWSSLVVCCILKNIGDHKNVDYHAYQNLAALAVKPAQTIENIQTELQ